MLVVERGGGTALPTSGVGTGARTSDAGLAPAVFAATSSTDTRTAGAGSVESDGCGGEAPVGTAEV